MATKLSFARDIRPLFRPVDIDEMSFAFDLATYHDVRDNAEQIYVALAQLGMPCDGPWADEDIARFRAWIDAGAPP